MHALVIVDPELLLVRSPVTIILKLDRAGNSCNTRFTVAIRVGTNAGGSTRSVAYVHARSKRTVTPRITDR